MYMFVCHFCVPVGTIFFTYGSLVLTVKAVSLITLTVLYCRYTVPDTVAGKVFLIAPPFNKPVPVVYI